MKIYYNIKNHILNCKVDIKSQSNNTQNKLKKLINMNMNLIMINVSRKISMKNYKKII